MFSQITVYARYALLLLLLVPVTVGVIGVVFPALGYFPALGEHSFSFRIFVELLNVKHIGQMIWLSLFSGVGSTILASFITFLLLAHCYQSSLLNKIQALLSPMLVLPHAAAAIALLFVLSPSGLVARFIGTITDSAMPSTTVGLFPYDEWGLSILLVLVIKEVPFILLMALSVMAQPNNKQKLEGYQRAGTALGYSAPSTFFKLILPSIYTQIKLPILAVLVFATSNVEIPLLIGLNNPSTLSVAILHWFNHVDLSMRLLGSAASILQGVVCVLAIVVFFTVERMISWWGRRQLSTGRRNFFNRTVALLGTCTVGIYAFLIAGVVYTVVSYSFAEHWVFPRLFPEALTLLHWKTAFSAIGQPLLNTLLLGLATSVSSVVLVLLTLESEVLVPATRKATALFSFSLFLPLLVPGVAFLYGLVWFQQLLSVHSLGFHTYIAHMVYVLPYVYLSLAVSYQRFDNHYVMVAQSLGKSPFQVFWYVKLPALLNSVLVAWALGLAISFSQYLPTMLASGGAIPTVTTEAVASVSGSSVRLTAVYAVIQALMPLLGFVIAWTLPKLITLNRERRRTHNRLSNRLSDKARKKEGLNKKVVHHGR